MWFCSLCRRPRQLVLAAKFAGINENGVGDICVSCIKMLAEEDIAMEKLDLVGAGYTDEVLKEGALKLLKCGSCDKWRSAVLLLPKGFLCSGCMLVKIYQNG